MTTITTPVERPLTALDVIFMRRSVRSYTNERLDQDTVRALLDAAVQAPTALREEPWTFVIVQDADALKRYSDLAKAQWVGGPVAERELQTIDDAALQARLLRTMVTDEFNVFYDARTLIVICAKPVGPWAVGDCWLAAENLMLAACAMGLGSCCIGCATPVLNSSEVKSELTIPPDVTVVAPIIVGAPRGVASPVGRKTPEILCWRR